MPGNPQRNSGSRLGSPHTRGLESHFAGGARVALETVDFLSVSRAGRKNTLRVTLSPTTPETKTFEVQAGWWLWTEEPLQRAILTMEFDESLPSVLAKVLPSPSGMEVQRQVIPLQGLQSFTSRSSTRLSE